MTVNPDLVGDDGKTPIYLHKYMKHTAEYNPLYRALAHTHINFV